MIHFTFYDMQYFALHRNSSPIEKCSHEEQFHKLNLYTCRQQQLSRLSFRIQCLLNFNMSRIELHATQG